MRSFERGAVGSVVGRYVPNISEDSNATYIRTHPPTTVYILNKKKKLYM